MRSWIADRIDRLIIRIARAIADRITEQQASTTHTIHVGRLDSTDLTDHIAALNHEAARAARSYPMGR